MCSATPIAQALWFSEHAGSLLFGAAVIPAFNTSGVLPPYAGSSPGVPGALSPYMTSMTAVVSRFGISRERLDILEGLLNYRSALKTAGIDKGYQWLDGSFVEDVERRRSRPPRDIDLVTFAYRPSTPSFKWADFVQNNLELFNPLLAKANFKCDAYYVDLEIPAHMVVQQTSYWCGLMAHQRETFLWKGILCVQLNSDDDAARTLL